MTKDYFIQLADYNIWANGIVHSWLDNISDAQWNQPVVSSFESIAATALHVVAAEAVWLDRLKKVENPIWLPSVFKGSKKELLGIWKNSSAEVKSFIDNLDENDLKVVLSFKRRDGVTSELSHYQIFGHMLNHSVYHRGQIVTMLRQVGFSNMTSTDLSTFFWNKKY